MSMQHFSATEAKQRLAALLTAVQFEPVIIRSRNRDIAIVLSPAEYSRLTGTDFAEQAAAAVRAERMVRASDTKANNGESSREFKGRCEPDRYSA